MEKNAKIIAGSDHAGFKYKEKIADILEKKGFSVTDFGCFSEESADYTDFAHPVAEAVEKDENARGILICGSGNGVCMTANKHKKVRFGCAGRGRNDDYTFSAAGAAGRNGCRAGIRVHARSHGDRQRIRI